MTPSGTWATAGTTWSTDSTGSIIPTALTTAAIDDLFFSAGTDATGSYTVTLAADQNAKSLTFQEGAATITANKVTLTGGGITVLAASGNPIISTSLTVNGNNIIDVGSGRTLTLNTGTFTRGTRATVSIRGGGTGSSTMTGLTANDATGIIGPWASSGSGTGTTYAKFSGSSLSGLGYTGGLDGTAAATAANVTSTLGTVNYTVAAVGTLGAGASVNTLRYGGVAGTIAGGLTTKGIMNAGTGLLTFSGAVTSGAAATELVVNTANAGITFSGVLTGTLVKTGSGTMTMGAAANIAANLLNMTVNEGILITETSTADGLGAVTVNSGGTARWGGGGNHSNTANWTVNAGGVFDVATFEDLIGGVTGAGSITGTTGRLLIGTNTTTFSGVISGSGMRIGIRDNAVFTLAGANTYTGTTAIGITTSAGTLSLTNSNALGTIPGTNGTSGIIIQAASILQSATAGTNPITTIAAPITLAAGGDTTLRIGQGAASNTHTFNINGAIGGATNNLIFTTTTGSFGNGTSLFVLGAPGAYTGNTLITTGNGANNPVVVRAGTGIVNALPAATVLTFDQVVGGGSGRTFQYDLNGNAQTLAGLSNGGVVPQGRNMQVTSSTAATLTINNTADFTFGGANIGVTSGTVRANITGAIALTKSGSGTFTLGGTLANSTSAPGNTFTGDTKITGGILVLGETISIQNSTFDTGGSIAGDPINGLRAGIGGTGVTSLTLGGLTGANSFASRFTTTTGGYTNLTNLTLNPGTGATPSYAGDVGNGNGSMTLTKSGVGTQTLAVAQTYSGGTNINAGTLALGGTGTLGVSGTALTLGGGSLDLGTLSNTVGAVSVTAAAASGDTISNGSLTGTSYAASHATGTAIISANLLVNGAAGFALSGAGNVTLSGDNTYSGGTSVTSTGALNLAHSNAAGIGTINLSSTQASTGNTLTLSGDINVANPIQIDASTGRENISSLSGSNTLSGNLTINNSGFFITFNNNGPAATTFTVGGATPNSTTITGSTYANTISFRAGTDITRLGVINSQINTPNATLDLNNFGNWTINSTGNNWLTTNISSPNGGLLKLGANDALATGALLNLSNAATGYLDMNGKNQQVAGLAGGNTTTPTVHIKNAGAADSTLTLAGLTANRSFAGIIADGDTNKISLVLNNGNAFTQTLTGANTYTGTTLVSAGKLLVNGSTHAAGLVTVSATATLGGSGSTGVVTVENGGTLSPGNSIDSLGVDSAGFDAGSIFDYEFDTSLYAGTPNASGDLLHIKADPPPGALNIASTAILTLKDLAITSTALPPGSKFTLISYSGTKPSGVFTYLGIPLADGDSITLDANTWQFDYDDTTGGLNFAADQNLATKFFTMSVVPEAGTAGLMALGLLLLRRLRRR